jgi:putative transcriptional regulator
LVDFARGALEPGRGLVVRTHLTACAACRATVRLAEAVGGALLAETPPVALDPDSLDLALARIERPAPPASPAPAVPSSGRPRDWIPVPSDVLSAFARRKRWAAPGVWVAPVSRDRRTGARSYLLGVGPGIAVPRHTHKGAELTCVLKGAFEDGESTFRAGDLAEADESLVHQPRVTHDGECVCLIAADSALIPRNLIGRLMQPFVGI